MKYFNPSYGFKLGVLSAPLFNDKTQGINAMSIDNKKIKDGVSKNATSLDGVNEKWNFINDNQTNLGLQTGNYNSKQTNETKITTNSNQPKKRSKRECIDCNYVNISQDPYLKGRRMIMRIMGADKIPRFYIAFDKKRKKNLYSFI